MDWWDTLVDALGDNWSWSDLVGPALTAGAGVYAANSQAEQNQYNRNQTDEQFQQQIVENELARELQRERMAMSLAQANAANELKAAIAKQQLQARGFEAGQSSALQGRAGESNALNALVQNLQRALLK